MIRVPLPGSLSTAIAAAQIHHQPPHDGEPQTGAAFLRRVEIVENPAGLLFGHSAARVGDRERTRRLAVSLDHSVETLTRPGFDSRLSTALTVQIFEDAPEGDGISGHHWEIRRQVRRELGTVAPLLRANHLCDQRVQIAIAPDRTRRQPLVAGRKSLKVGDAGIDCRTPLGEDDGKGAGLVAFRPAPDAG